jgi:hypothetical protein
MSANSGGKTRAISIKNRRLDFWSESISDITVST